MILQCPKQKPSNCRVVKLHSKTLEDESPFFQDLFRESRTQGHCKPLLVLWCQCPLTYQRHEPPLVNSQCAMQSLCKPTRGPTRHNLLKPLSPRRTNFEMMLLLRLVDPQASSTTVNFAFDLVWTAGVQTPTVCGLHTHKTHKHFSDAPRVTIMSGMNPTRPKDKQGRMVKLLCNQQKAANLSQGRHRLVPGTGPLCPRYGPVGHCPTREFYHSIYNVT